MPSTTDMVFLDANASAAVLPQAKAALLAALDVPGNPSSPHAIGRKKRLLLDEARDHVAGALGCSDKNVMFTSGATEGLRFVVEALGERSRQRDDVLKVWTSPLEHPAVHKNLERAQHRGLLNVIVGDVDAEGRVDFEQASSADAVLCTRAHNETGILVDVDALCDVVTDDCIVCVDASQAVARLPVLPARVDVGVCSAHKLGGVSGCGAVFLRQRAKDLSAGWTGGGQESQLRPGTEATALVAAMGAACAVIDDTRQKSQALAPLRDALEDAVVALDPVDGEGDARQGLFVVGKAVDRLPQTSAIAFCGVGPEALRMWADREGLAVGFGSACSALAPHASTALLALGLDEKTARSTMRLSLDLDVTQDVVDEAQRRLGQLIDKMKKRRR